MRDQTKVFVQKFIKEKGKPTKVLEVGSLNVNGTIREYLEGCEYVGLDMRDGDNVDVVLDAHDLRTRYSKETFDVVMCFDTLEHDAQFWVTVANMRWVLKKGGWLLIGVPSRYCPYHEHPSDYWRFMAPAMKDSMLEGYEEIHVQVDLNGETEDEIYGWGRKP